MPVRSYAVLALLTLVAGYADAVAFFGIGVFTANMTGNTVLLAAALVKRLMPHAPGDFSVTLLAISLPCFLLGAVVATLVLRGETGRPPVRTIAVMAGITALMVIAAILYSRGVTAAPWCVVVLSTIAGMQAVVAARAGVPGITTVVVTGILVTAILDFFGSGSGSERRKGVPYAIDWVVYFVGAALGMVGFTVLGGAAFWPPAVVVALALPVL